MAEPGDVVNRHAGVAQAGIDKERLAIEVAATISRFSIRSM